MKFNGVEIKDFHTLCKKLTVNQIEKIYLIHPPNRESEARQFASWLKNKGFMPMVASDYRKHGMKGVERAIAESDFVIVLAFDDNEMKECEKLGVSFIKFR